MTQADEQSFEVVLPRLLDLAPLDVNVVYRQLFFLDQVTEVKAERTDVLGQFLCGFLEGEEHTWLIVQNGSPNDELYPQRGLAAASPAAHQGGPAFGQPAARDLVQPLNASRTLGQTRWRRLLFRCGLANGVVFLDRLLTPHPYQEY